MTLPIAMACDLTRVHRLDLFYARAAVGEAKRALRAERGWRNVLPALRPYNARIDAINAEDEQRGRRQAAAS